MKAHNMLSEQQMREYQNCFTKTALDLLINQMHEIWNIENYVVFLLILDIMKIYNRTVILLITSIYSHTVCLCNKIAACW